VNVGIARAKITPPRPVWMAGYAARDHHSEGVYQDLFAKALALDDGANRAALITTDLLFFDDILQRRIEAWLRDSLGLQPREIILTASHTHCGPALVERQRSVYPDLDEEYLADLVTRVGGAVEAAFAGLREAPLAFGIGTCDMGVNRRLTTPDGVVMQPNPDGPADPQVAVLRAGDAVVINYACHPTTMGGYLIGGDYPGFAQRIIEQLLPNAQAMFVQGCGGDVKPRNVGPDGRFQSGPLEAVERCGRQLADVVWSALNGSMQPVDGPITTRRADFELPLADPPTRAQAQAALDDSNPFRAKWGKRMLEIMDGGGEFERARPAMVQVLTVGDLALVALSGEVCVEIGLRIKRLLPGRPLIVAAYAGPAGLTSYVAPTSRFPEGGYEVDGNYFYALWPAPLRPDAEEIILRHVQDLTATPS
jgi:hypothetical protein